MQKGKPAWAACRIFLFLLLLLLLTPVSPQCRTASAAECDQIEEFIPGHYLATQGFDITSLEYKLNSVFDLSEWEKSEGSCTLCENPLLRGKPLQRLPLAITDWEANISCQEKVQHSVVLSAISVAKVMTELRVKNDWKKELDMEVKSSADIQWAFTGSASEMASFFEFRNVWAKYTFLLHHVSCSFYKFRISMLTHKSVNKKFKNEVKILPEKYELSSKTKYHDLIEKYGTHFPTDFELGARVSVLTAVPVCGMVLDGSTISEIRVCLEIELGITIGLNEVTNSPDYEKCKKKKKNPFFSFLLSVFNREMEGGDFETQLSGSIKWLESAKRLPDLLSYSLEPLHTLLDNGDPRREGLRQAVSDYVKEKALRSNCTDPCPPEIHECPNDNFTNSMCCPKQRGLAKLTVTIYRAEGLWGDYVTRTDAYVNVFYQDKVLCTSTVWNNNNPEWNESLDFGIIQLTESSEVHLQIWDEDFGWDDDLLGNCVLSLVLRDPWDPLSSYVHVCFLSHGSLHYTYHLACIPHLKGPFCRDYFG